MSIERGRFRGPRYAFRGDHLSLYQIARIVGVPAETFRRRVLKYGMTVEEAAKAGRRLYPLRKSRLYSLHGAMVTAMEAAQRLGLSLHTIYGRVSGNTILDGLDLIDPFGEPGRNTLVIRNSNKRAIKRITRVSKGIALARRGITATTIIPTATPIPTLTGGCIRTFTHSHGTGAGRRETHLEGARP